VTGDEGYFLARLINALFKERPSCAYYVFASITALVLGIMLLKAESRDELSFPILGLVFISIVVVIQAIHDVRQRHIKDFRKIVETPLEFEQEIQEIEESPQELEPLQLHINHRLSQTISQSETSQQPPQSVILQSPNVKYPNLRAKEFLQLLVVGAIFLSIGYVVAHIFFADKLIALFAKSPDPISAAENAKWAAGVIKNIGIQLICGFSWVIPFALVISGSLILLRKLIGIGRGVLMTIVATVGLVLGFVVYFPIQFLYLLLAAF